MNRLWVRLTLAFVLVALLVAGASALAIAWNASRQFRGYLAQPGVLTRGWVLETLEAHYEIYGSWANVGQTLNAVRLRPRRRPRDLRQPLLLIADAQGRVVYDEIADQRRVGQTLDGFELAAAQPVLMDSAVVGYVLAGLPVAGLIGPLERRFLEDLQRSAGVIAFGSAVLGAGAGLLISRSLSRPLTLLAQAARAFAARDWSQRVPLKATAHVAEVHEVAQAFNHMANSLEQAEIQRRNLMADVAHELRTPLTVIQGSLRAMLDGVHPLSMKEVATLYDQARLLSRLVEDVRELALAEAHQLPLTLRAVDLAGLVRTAYERFSVAADLQGVALVLDLPPEPLRAMADPDRVIQVLTNLLSNALRHTPAGGQVVLSGQRQAGVIRLAVQDTGEGIAPEDLPHVFDRFYRSDKSRARSSGGSGLGLAIAKSLVEGMGGQIGADSEPGRGSTFWFTLPLAVR
jgi:signal transduction histidine kinase